MSKRVTVFCTEEDIKLLLRLCVDHAGASEPELFRLGIRALAGQSPNVRLMPQLAPPADIRETLASVRGWTRQLEQAIRHGWPDHIEGESPERYRWVEDARRDFEKALAQILPLQRSLILLVAAMATLPTIDIDAVRRGAQRVETASVKHSELSALADFLKRIGVLV